jgi:hypothetical protein
MERNMVGDIGWKYNGSSLTLGGGIKFNGKGGRRGHSIALSGNDRQRRDFQVLVKQYKFHVEA